MLRIWIAALALSGGFALPALGAPMPLVDPGGDDSGWKVSWDETVVSVTVRDVDRQAGTVRISIVKDFGPAEDDGEGGMEVPDALLTFAPSGTVTPVNMVIVQDETIHNNSGVTWKGFAWAVLNAAEFRVDESAGWVVSPFQRKRWMDQVGNAATNLVADSGSLADGGDFTPSGDLTIYALGTAPFTLKQIEAPEPCTLAILAAAACGALARRRVRRC